MIYHVNMLCICIGICFIYFLKSYVAGLTDLIKINFLFLELDSQESTEKYLITLE